MARRQKIQEAQRTLAEIMASIHAQGRIVAQALEWQWLTVLL